jgi:hypothetical protein
VTLELERLETLKNYSSDISMYRGRKESVYGDACTTCGTAMQLTILDSFLVAAGAWPKGRHILDPDLKRIYDLLWLFRASS